MKTRRTEITAEYVVENIVEKRCQKSGKRLITEYKVKWEGYESSENTWEPLRNLQNCREMIREYEQQLKDNGEHEPPKKRGRKKARAPRGQKRVTRQRRDSSEEPWIPDEIVGCKQGVSGDLEFLFKWKNDIKASFLTFKQARFAYPLEVIEFYERILEFSPQSA